MRRASTPGAGAGLGGQLEVEWNKNSICTWGCASVEYQSPSKVKGEHL